MCFLHIWAYLNSSDSLLCAIPGLVGTRLLLIIIINVYWMFTVSETLLKASQWPCEVCKACTIINHLLDGPWPRSTQSSIGKAKTWINNYHMAQAWTERSSMLQEQVESWLILFRMRISKFSFLQLPSQPLPFSGVQVTCASFHIPGPWLFP